MKSVPLLITVAGWMCPVRAWSWSGAKNSRQVFKTDGINNCNYTGRLLGLCTDGFCSRDSCINTNIEMFADTSSDFFFSFRNLSCVVFDSRSEIFAAHPAQIFVVDFY